MDADGVLRRRLAVQRLTSSPLDDPVEVVRLLTCVQAQDAPLARFSVGMRTAGATEATVWEALDRGRIVRTHVLRPTWHFVAAEDLPWILELTSRKVESAMAARHRQLGLDAVTIDRALEHLTVLLSGHHHPNRPEVAAAFAAAGLPGAGESVGHLLLLAELRGLVCSGPLRGRQHTYALTDEVVGLQRARPREDAVRELVLRFFSGHGPAAVTDLTRWTTLTQAEIKPALADLGDRLDTTVVDGTTLWFDPALVARARPGRRAFLVPTFDEVYLSYPRLNFPRAEAHSRQSAPHPFAEAGGGVVVCDRHDAGWWKRKEGARNEVMVTVRLAGSLDGDQRAAVAAAAERLAHFTGRDLVLDLA